MAKKFAIEVEDLCIRYREIQKYSIKKNLLRLKKLEVEEFEAVSHVSFKVKKGEILGVIGRNGCGKSTLLKAIAGVFSPDEGKVDLHENSVSLLAIGVGFKTQLTGRENIFLTGMLLGFTEEEIEEKLPSILKFADLGKFIDKPVNTYSSGMHSKLSFAINIKLATDIILIDEVLSVGDQKFKVKSYRAMKKLITQKNKTVIIVSHNISTLEELCDRIMWMQDGKIVKIGKPQNVLKMYQDYMNRDDEDDENDKKNV